VAFGVAAMQTLTPSLREIEAAVSNAISRTSETE
jgi:hypothetical protein